VQVGDIVWGKVDVALLHDSLGPRVVIAEGLKKMQAEIWDKKKVVLVSDHYTPPSNIHQANILAFTRKWARDNQIENFYEFEGTCHQVLVDRGFVKPGALIVGTDSHTCTAGAFGALATGIGSTEMLGVLMTGELWLKVPSSILIRCDGSLKPGIIGI